MALLTKWWGPKEQVREAYLPFYRIQNGTVTSLQRSYDVTGKVPNTSLTVPGDVGKRINRSWERLKKRNGGATVTKVRGLSNHTVWKGHIRLYRDTCIFYVWFQENGLCDHRELVYALFMPYFIAVWNIFVQEKRDHYVQFLSRILHNFLEPCICFSR